MADNNSKQRITVIAVSSVILVAMVVALIVGSVTKSTNDNGPDLNASTKAIKTICDSTDYKDVCIKSLNSTAGNSTDPKELIEAAFQVTIKSLQDAVNKSILLQNLQQDPRTKLALENCQELADRAVSDLQNSFSMFQSFDFNNLKDMLNDMKVWISGALTYQETCLDGFEDTTGDAGEKMKEVLKTGMELTSNGLAMITDVSSVITSLDILPSFKNRRLLSEKSTGQDNSSLGLDLPDWLDSKSRRLLNDVDPVNATIPNLIVAKDGSGNYTNINDALNDIPTRNNETFVLYIKEGVYKEKITFYRNLTHLMIIGDGPTKTRITGDLNFIDGTPTYHTATVSVLGEYFIAKDIGFENSAGAEKHQAVALRVGADKSVFYNCHMDGYQDTLYVHTYRQFYRNCVVSGTIDFVFGDSASIFQNCTFVVRKPLDNQQCIVTAQGRKDVRQPTGIVLQNCNIVADPAYHPLRKKIKSYLGRPWKEFSRTIIMETYIDDLIQPEGWLAWEGTFALNTLFYTEFNNRGPGSVKSHRVKWPGVKELQANRVQRYTASSFIEAETWIPASGVPFDPEFILPIPKENASVTYSPVEPEEVKDLGLPKEDNLSSELINGSLNMAPATLPTPEPTADINASPPPPTPTESGLSPSPAPYTNSFASPPIQGVVSPSSAPFVNVVASPPSPAPFVNVVPSPAPYTDSSSTSPPSPSPSIDAASPLLEGAAPPAPTPENVASPPTQGTTPPAPTPENVASSPTQGATPPAPTPENAASPPTQGTSTPPAPTPENAASLATEGTTPPAPTPENVFVASLATEGTTTPPAPTPENVFVASLATEGTTPPAPTPENAASPPAQQGTTPPAPTPDVNSAPPPTQGTTPPAPAPYVNSASPPVEGGNLPSMPPQSPAAESTAPSPSSSGANVDSQTSSSPSQSPSSQ